MKDSNGTLVFEGPQEVAAYAFLAAFKALQFEIKTGMKMTRFPILPVVKRNYGITARTKVAAFEQMVPIWEALMGKAYEGWRP